jgi:hypothetical protein
MKEGQSRRSHPLVTGSIVSPPGLAICRIQTSGGQPDTLAVSGRKLDCSFGGDKIRRRQAGFRIHDIAVETPELFHEGVAWDDWPAWFPLGDEIAVQVRIKVISCPGRVLMTVLYSDHDGSGCKGEFPAVRRTGRGSPFPGMTHRLTA